MGWTAEILLLDQISTEDLDAIRINQKQIWKNETDESMIRRSIKKVIDEPDLQDLSISELKQILETKLHVESSKSAKVCTIVRNEIYQKSIYLLTSTRWGQSEAVLSHLFMLANCHAYSVCIPFHTIYIYKTC